VSLFVANAMLSLLMAPFFSRSVFTLKARAGIDVMILKNTFSKIGDFDSTYIYLGSS
jgi:hypothetical protein